MTPAAHTGRPVWMRCRALIGAGLLLLGAGFMPAGAAGQPSSAERGEALYTGRAPLVGRLVGHSTDLPPDVVVCLHCHGGAGSSSGGNSFSNGLAPRLEGGWLKEFRSRRNGPAGRYDLPAFCRTLRTGVDPQQIQLPSRMPRFNLPDSDCEDLWNYLNPPAEALPETPPPRQAGADARS